MKAPVQQHLIGHGESTYQRGCPRFGPTAGKAAKKIALDETHFWLGV